MSVCLYVCMSVCLYVCMPVCLYVCMSVCLYVCMSVCLYVCLYVCMYVCMYVCVCLYVCMSVCLYVCMSVCLYVCMSVCLYVCMSVCLYVCMSVCLYVCMYVCVYINIYLFIRWTSKCRRSSPIQVWSPSKSPRMWGGRRKTAGRPAHWSCTRCLGGSSSVGRWKVPEIWVGKSWNETGNIPACHVWLSDGNGIYIYIICCYIHEPISKWI